MKFLLPVLVFLVIAMVLAGIVRDRVAVLVEVCALQSTLLSFRVGALLAKPPDEDIIAPTGTPIYSATNGTVPRIGNAAIGGNAVSVPGAGGRAYYYAALSGFAEGLRAGQDVTPDSVLLVASTFRHLRSLRAYGPIGAANGLPAGALRARISAPRRMTESGLSDADARAGGSQPCRHRHLKPLPVRASMR